MASTQVAVSELRRQGVTYIGTDPSPLAKFVGEC